MKKTYTAPALAEAGGIVRQTLGGSNPVAESSNGFITDAGAVGFYL